MAIFNLYGNKSPARARHAYAEKTGEGGRGTRIYAKGVLNSKTGMYNSSKLAKLAKKRGVMR